MKKWYVLLFGAVALLLSLNTFASTIEVLGGGEYYDEELGQNVSWQVVQETYDDGSYDIREQDGSNWWTYHYSSDDRLNRLDSSDGYYAEYQYTDSGIRQYAYQTVYDSQGEVVDRSVFRGQGGETPDVFGSPMGIFIEEAGANGSVIRHFTDESDAMDLSETYDSSGRMTAFEREVSAGYYQGYVAGTIGYDNDIVTRTLYYSVGDMEANRPSVVTQSKDVYENGEPVSFVTDYFYEDGNLAQTTQQKKDSRGTYEEITYTNPDDPTEQYTERSYYPNEGGGIRYDGDGNIVSFMGMDFTPGSGTSFNLCDGADDFIMY